MSGCAALKSSPPLPCELFLLSELPSVLFLLSPPHAILSATNAQRAIAQRGKRRQEGLWVLNSNPATAPLKSHQTFSGQKKHAAAPAQFYVTGFKTPVIRSCANVRLEFKVCHFSHWGLCYVALCGEYETTCPWSAPISLWCKSHAWLAARNLSVHLRANRLY